jgi:tRNA-2-methylthio-N6-dimethylallyladenosine synthase
VIVGHPGETRAHFEATLALAQEIRFDKVHIAAYSARPGTRAFDMEQDPALAVSDAEKRARHAELEQVQERIATERNAQLHGRQVEVLVEGEHKGKWRGRTPGNKLVFFADSRDWAGKLAHVHITHTGPWALQGDLVGEGVPA